MNVDPERYHVLLEFAYRHLEFQIPEIESVLEMNGIKMNSDECKVVELPNHERFLAEQGSKGRRPFFMLSFSPDSKYVPGNGEEDIGSILLARCTLLRSALELWGVAETFASCASQTQHWITNTRLGKSVFDKCSSKTQSWKISIATLGRKYSREEQTEMRDYFKFLDLKGDVVMKDPINEFVLIREAELDLNGNALYHRHDYGKIIPENDARPPLACYFGRALGGKRFLKGRAELERYSLKRRAYLGPTSMDTELAFIMTNLAQIKKGAFVIDPFVGTGSILLSCALRGAYCMGTDIDIRVIRGRGEKENIWSNFDQFDLARPEIVRSDNAIYHRHYRTNVPLYDAIICDPPYGIRAGARKTGSRRENPAPVLDEHRHDHIAQTKPYAVSDVMADLLDMAANTLVMGGLLVYIIPSFQEFDPDKDLPRHDCLKMTHICYQPLSSELGRRVVALKKVAEYVPSKREDYLSCVWMNGVESAAKCANIKARLLEEAQKKPGYERRLSERRRKRKLHREEKKTGKRLNA